MNILLVDDDIYLVEAIKTMIHWEKLGIDEVYTANSMGQAKKILVQIPMELMVCDIEMPQGSGLELMEWCRSENITMEIAVLSSYAKFEYARQAIKLGGYDYLLKPLPYDELEIILEKMVGKVMERRKSLEVQNAYERLNRNQDQLSSVFWQNVLNEVSPSHWAQGKNQGEDDRKIRKEYEARGNLDFSVEEGRFLVVVIDILDYQVIYETLEKGMDSFTIKDVLSETGHKHGYQALFFMEKERDDLKRWHVIFQVLETADAKAVFAQDLVLILSRSMTDQLKCYFGSASGIGELSEQTAAMGRMAENYVNTKEQIFYLDQYIWKDIAAVREPFLQWMGMISAEDYEGVQKSIHHFLTQKSFGDSFGTEFLYMIDHLYQEMQIQPDTIIELVESMKERHMTAQSLERMAFEQLDCMRKKLKQHKMEGEDCICYKVKAYIEEHLAEDLNRNSFSEAFYLNPDYLARLFKQAEGISIGNYLIQARMNFAKKQLEDSRQPVNFIAVQCGYTNFSYFSKLFRKCTGYTPNEYRKHNP